MKEKVTLRLTLSHHEWARIELLLASGVCSLGECEFYRRDDRLNEFRRLRDLIGKRLRKNGY